MVNSKKLMLYFSADRIGHETNSSSSIQQVISYNPKPYPAGHDDTVLKFIKSIRTEATVPHQIQPNSITTLIVCHQPAIIISFNVTTVQTLPTNGK